MASGLQLAWVGVDGSIAWGTNAVHKECSLEPLEMELLYMLVSYKDLARVFWSAVISSKSSSLVSIVFFR